MTSSTPSSAFTPGMNLHPIYRNPLVWGMGIVILIMAAVIAFMAVSGDGEKETARETPADTQAALAYIEAETATKPVLEVRTPTITLAETPRPTDPTVPSSTPIATPSSAPSETPAITLTFSEVEKEATIQAAMNARLTLTATQWTLTPTITPTATEDLEATADARLAQTQTVFDAASTAAAGTETQAAAIIKATNNAEAAETQFALDQTATAILWTATPTVTPSPTLTATFTLTSEPTHIPTVTPDLLPFALERAQNFSGNNDDWEPFVQEFNSVKMVLVPPGCFMMGSDSGEEDQKPVHEVCFEEPFWIDRTEVTTAQYGSYNYNWPQASVTWVQARNFCDRRGGRLPTEAEWEYAARGPEGWVYPWGNEFIAENVVYLDRRFTSDMYIEVVGSRQRGASWVGALDMSGNVWEWVSTIYQPYPYNALDGRENDTDSRSRRVVRGGAASVENQDYLRTTYRSDWDPSIRSESGGFRCARSADETSQTIASAEPTSAPTFVADALQEVFFPAGSSNHDWMPMIQEFDGVQMVLVPAGCFEMGGTEYDDEKPVHRVCFEETFWIDRTEVTNGQFVRFNGQAAYESYVSDGDRPRENITWIEAQAFCESRGARLPTEAEWEYVARGPEGWKYSWGNEFDDNKAIWNRSINDRTAPVGSLPVGMSWVGTLDMSGNVWEWVADWYGETYYASLEAGVINPTGPETGEYRVLRGGSWADEWDGVLRAAFRGNSDTLGDSGGNMGFRCARSFDESVPPPVTSAEPPPVADASQEVFFPAGSSNRDWTPMIQTFDGVEMVLVPAGCFEMGSESGDSDEYPVHQVCFDEPFWIGRTEVTNGQFAALNGHGQFADSNGQAANSSYFSGVDRPREQITWAEANAFCESRGARLPTEAEWEYAARGPEAWVYPWGDEFDSSQAIWNRGSSDGTASVGSLPAGASWVGALDMSGNVWEWVADWYGENYYSGLADGLINPAGPASGENRVLRGGSWNGSSTYNLRAAFRWPENPSVGDFDGGFRCARSR
jgi:formylglycine-generating enzyme required for sulfatase activity